MTDTPQPAAMAEWLTGDLFTIDRYFFHEVLDSTNREAARLADDGAAEGTVVVADRQTRGRGRLGRTWISPAGVNLYFSMILRPDIPIRHAAQLTLLAGLALAEEITTCMHRSVNGRPDGLEIKWPNDLMLQGRKLAGILTEMRAEGDRPRQVVLGIGINVNGRSDALPPPLHGRAITLAEHLRETIKRSSLLAGFLSTFEQRYKLYLTKGFAPIRQAWLDHSNLLGRRVQVNLTAEKFSGRAVEMDADGFLLVKRDDGRLSRVVAGDVLPIASTMDEQRISE